MEEYKELIKEFNKAEEDSLKKFKKDLYYKWLIYGLNLGLGIMIGYCLCMITIIYKFIN